MAKKVASFSNGVKVVFRNGQLKKVAQTDPLTAPAAPAFDAPVDSDLDADMDSDLGSEPVEEPTDDFGEDENESPLDEDIEEEYGDDESLPPQEAYDKLSSGEVTEEDGDKFEVMLERAIVEPELAAKCLSEFPNMPSHIKDLAEAIAGNTDMTDDTDFGADEDGDYVDTEKEDMSMPLGGQSPAGNVPAPDSALSPKPSPSANSASFSMPLAKNKKSIRTAQRYTSMETMPKDMTDGAEDLFDIPRDKSVGFDQTAVDVTVYDYEYALGDNGCDTSIVPRDGSGDGIGGRKVTFEDEKADGYSSGSPDTYIQKVQPRIKPEPRGSKKNHAVAAADYVKKIATLKQALQAKEAEIRKLKTDIKREVLARKIAYVEKEFGIMEFPNEESFETRVAAIKKDTPAPALLRELERVKASAHRLTQVAKNANKTVTATRRQTGFEANGGVSLQTAAGAANHYIQSDVVRERPDMNASDLTRKIQENLYLGKLFPNS